MILHNLRIAWKSLGRNRALSALLVMGIALGIAVATTMATFRHSFAKHPIPEKEDTLRYVRLDSWDPLKPYTGNDPTQPPTQITYRDMVGIMKSTIPVRQSGMYVSNLYVYPDPKVSRPFRELVRLCYSDFFPMFDVPFRYGSGWDKNADARPETVAVLSDEMNEKLFGGHNSVGKTVRLADRDFKVVGVLAPWKPNVRYYDLTQNALAPVEKIYIPFNFLRPMQVRTNGNVDGWGTSSAPGPEGFLQSESCWIQFWVELPNPAAVAAYQDFLNAYVLEQKKSGRFARPLNNRLSTVSEWMRITGVVPQSANAMLIVSLLFLAVCAVNLVGLLLGKFLARGGEVGVRRALGASRTDIFVQHIVECELVAIVGGVVGIALSLAALAGMNAWLKTFQARGEFFRLDAPMILLSIGLALAAGFVAGAYPAWRTCRLPPAEHLKI